MKKYIGIIIVAFVVVFLGVNSPVFAVDNDTKAAACTSIGGTMQDGFCVEPGGNGKTINSLVATIINLFSWVVGIMAVVFIIYGGFRYVTSGGDSGKVASAKNTIIYALVGLVIAALAQVIVQFVISKVTPAKTAEIIQIRTDS